MEASEITLGMRVHAPDTLHRDREYTPGGGGHTKTWLRHAERQRTHRAEPRPVTGIIVGIRLLDEKGITHWGYDEPTTWTRTGERRTAVLIATNLRANPARAWIEDVTPEGENDHA